MYDSCHARCYSNMSDDSNSPTDRRISDKYDEYDETLSVQVHVKRSPTHVKTELHSCARVTTCGHALCAVNSPLHSTAQSTVRKSEGPQFTACGPTGPQPTGQRAKSPTGPQIPQIDHNCHNRPETHNTIDSQHKNRNAGSNPGSNEGRKI